MTSEMQHILDEYMSKIPLARAPTGTVSPAQISSVPWFVLAYLEYELAY